jgi:1,2-diacylglycerol 3-alpha-glucosyltransferase
MGPFAFVPGCLEPAAAGSPFGDVTVSHTDSLDFAPVPSALGGGRGGSTRIAVIWIDWYAYHVARFRALVEHPRLQASGIELVGGAGVHGKLVFRATESGGLPITTLLPDHGWKDAGQWRLARKLWAKLNELNPDAVLIPGYYTIPAIAATFWARLHGKTTILMSESTFQDHVRNRFKEAMKGQALRLLFHGSIAGGVRQVAYLRTLGFRENQIAYLYDVVDNDFYRDHAEEWRRRGKAAHPGLPDDYFLFVGRLSPEKNVDGLIKAFAQYRQAGGTWSLVLIGDGPSAAGLKAQAAAAGIADWVVFAGLKGAVDIAPYYAFAGCFVLPSHREPWGLVVNEAMAAGLPLIVSDRCGCADDLLEPDKNGFLFDPSDPHQLSPLLTKLADLSPERRQRMARRSREIIAKYSPGLWAEEVVRIAGIKAVANSSIA